VISLLTDDVELEIPSSTRRQKMSFPTSLLYLVLRPSRRDKTTHSLKPVMVPVTPSLIDYPMKIKEASEKRKGKGLEEWNGRIRKRKIATSTQRILHLPPKKEAIL